MHKIAVKYDVWYETLRAHIREAQAEYKAHA